MIQIPDIPELELFGVYDQGVPYTERVVINVRESVNLARYGLMVGQKAGPQIMQPFRDHFYWFGAMQVDKGHRIFVYTCRGEFRATTVEGTAIPALVFHWQRERTLFSPQVTVALMRMDGLAVEKSPPLVTEEPAPDFYAELLKLMKKP